MLIVKDKGTPVQPVGTLRDGAPFLWDGRLYIKIPSLSSRSMLAMNNTVNLATATVSDLPPSTLVTPVVINEVHIREL